MTKRFAAVLTLGFACGAFAPVACTVPNPDHCVNNGGDEHCADLYPDGDKPFCSDSSCVENAELDGCVAEEPTGCWFCDGKPGDECSEDASGDGDGDSGDGDGDGDSGDGDGDSGDGDGDSGDGDGDVLECMSSSECVDPAMPLCDAGACVGCGDAAATDCAGEYPETPVCDTGNGMCVLCSDDDATACEGGTPVCMDNSCVPCTEHEQCGGSACRLDEGTCFDLDAVWHVDGDNGADCGGADGSEENPFCTIGAGVDAVGNGGSGVVVIHEQDMDAPYNEAILATTEAEIALLGATGESPRWALVDGTALTILGVKVFIHRLWIANATQNCIYMGAGGDVSVTSSRVVNGGQHSILMDSGSLNVQNSFVSVQASSQSAVRVNNGEFEISYSTLVVGTSGGSSGLSCTSGGGSTITNSVLLSQGAGPELDCNGVTETNVFLEADSPEAFGENAGWFVDFAQGDFHIAPDAPALVVEAMSSHGVWNSGDPLTDIDGDLRAAVDGEATFVGADVP